MPNSVEQGSNNESRVHGIKRILSTADAKFQKFIVPLSTNPKEIKMLGQIYGEKTGIKLEGNILGVIPNELLKAKSLAENAHSEDDFEKAEKQASYVSLMTHQVSEIAAGRALDASSALRKGLDKNLGIEPLPTTGEQAEQVAKAETAPEPVKPEIEKKKGLLTRMSEGAKAILAKLKASLTSDSKPEEIEAVKKAEQDTARIEAGADDPAKIDEAIAQAGTTAENMDHTLFLKSGERNVVKPGWSAIVEGAAAGFREGIAKARERVFGVSKGKDKTVAVIESNPESKLTPDQQEEQIRLTQEALAKANDKESLDEFQGKLAPEVLELINTSVKDGKGDDPEAVKAILKKALGPDSTASTVQVLNNNEIVAIQGEKAKGRILLYNDPVEGDSAGILLDTAMKVDADGMREFTGRIPDSGLVILLSPEAAKLNNESQISQIIQENRTNGIDAIRDAIVAEVKKTNPEHGDITVSVIEVGKEAEATNAEKLKNLATTVNELSARYKALLEAESQNPNKAKIDLDGYIKANFPEFTWLASETSVAGQISSVEEFCKTNKDKPEDQINAEELAGSIEKADKIKAVLDKTEEYLKSQDVMIAPVTPTEPTTPITFEQQQKAEKLTKALLDAMRKEELQRLMVRGYEARGIWRGLFQGKQIKADANTEVDKRLQEVEKDIKEYALQMVTDRQITASGNEMAELMQKFGFTLKETKNGGFEFEPPHDQKGGIGSILRRLNPTGATFVGGLVAGRLGRLALAPLLGTGLLGAFGGGAIIGGIFGGIRAGKEATEGLMSGDAWLTDVDAALKSGNEAEIEAACHKVERLMADETAKAQYFKNRTRVEASRLLNRYREGVRRLSLNRMANEVETSKPEEKTPEAIAGRYAEFCKKMANDGEEKFMDEYGAAYGGALAKEVGLITVREGKKMGDEEKRRLNENTFNSAAAEKAKAKKERIVKGVITGALIGGVAGGAGWMIGHWLTGLADGGHHDGGVVGGAGTTGPEAGGVGGVQEAGGQHFGYFTNENTMPEQGNTLIHGDNQGFGELFKDPNCPRTMIDGQWYGGTDQGAAMREAVRVFDSKGMIDWTQVDAKGIDHNHIINLMNYAGAHNDAVSVDTGAGYAVSSEALQQIINGVAENGDQAVFGANAILAESGMAAAQQTLENGSGGAVAGGAAGAAEAVKHWPGWIFLAGALGFGAGQVADELKRKAERDGSDASAKLGEFSGVSSTGGPLESIDSYAGPAPTAPKPPVEPTTIEPTPTPTPVEPAPVAPTPEEIELAKLKEEKERLTEKKKELESSIETKKSSLAKEGLFTTEEALAILKRHDDEATAMSLSPETKAQNLQQELFRLINEKAEGGYKLPDGVEKSGDLATTISAEWLKTNEEIKELQSQLDDVNAAIAEIDSRLPQAETPKEENLILIKNAETEAGTLDELKNLKDKMAKQPGTWQIVWKDGISRSDKITISKVLAGALQIWAIDPSKSVPDGKEHNTILTMADLKEMKGFKNIDEQPAETPPPASPENETNEEDETIAWEAIDPAKPETIKTSLTKLKEKMDASGGEWQVTAKAREDGKRSFLSRFTQDVSEATVKTINLEQNRIVLEASKASGEGTQEFAIWKPEDFNNIDQFTKIKSPEQQGGLNG